MSKSQLRARANKQLATISPENKKQQSANICHTLEQYNNKYEIWAVFIPFVYEPNITSFIEQLWKQNKTVLVPQIDGDWLRLAYYNADSIITQWIYGEWIIQNPVWHQWLLDVCLVPWLAFDLQGNRLGHGKWYYDKFLAVNNCYRIGVCHKETIVENIPHNNLDQWMNLIITEHQL